VAFALAHNHPYGDPSPSAEDTTLNDRIAEAAAVVGLTFVDHVIVGESTWVSMREAEIAAPAPLTDRFA
jgi:DNA repair protein RadC